MRVLVNALSVTNMSGRHVLMGHLSRLAEWTRGEHEYVVLFHAANRDICRDLGAHVSWQECPGFTAHWAGRAAWESARLPSLASKVKADFMFTPSGTVVPGLSLPQVSFAQNPWSLVRDLQRNTAESIKAGLQRRNYRQAMHKAAMMIFNSEYMRSAYRENAGFRERRSEVVYQALDEETHQAAAVARRKGGRKDLQILSVSAWAPHKGVETVLEALRLLRTAHGVPANLVLAGPWPDAAYAQRMRKLISQHRLEDAVVIRGHVSREELDRLYAESRIFTLMSHCESFGIPALEAQAFGTPVVSSNCCAIPEICGGGGVYPQPGDSVGVAEKMVTLLNDTESWTRLSEQAVANAAKFHWAHCSRKLLNMFTALESA